MAKKAAKNSAPKRKPASTRKAAPPKKAAGSARSAKGSNARANGSAKPKRTAPRSQVLPGMEQVRDQILDHAHEQIAEGRGLMSRGRELEQEGIGVALQRMQKQGIKAYRHAGIESVFSPGVDKLRVRMTKEAEHTANGPAASSDEETQADEPTGADLPEPEFDDETGEANIH